MRTTSPPRDAQRHAKAGAEPHPPLWKAGVMSGAIQLEEIDTEAFKDRYGKLAMNVAPECGWN